MSPLEQSAANREGHREGAYPHLAGSETGAGVGDGGPAGQGLFALGGLVFDGGRAISRRQRAANEAEQAARVGADAVSIDSLRGDGPLLLDPVRAHAAAHSHLATTGDTGRIDVTPGGVTVRVDVVVETAILGSVGVTRSRSPTPPARGSYAESTPRSHDAPTRRQRDHRQDHQ